MIQHKSPISGIDSFSDLYVATAGYDNQVILWDQNSKTPIAKGTHDHLVNYCSFSTCGTMLVTASSDYTGRLWEIPTMKLLAVYAHHEDDVENITISPDNKWVATASRDNKVRLFELNGSLIREFKGHQMDVISVAFNLENKELISCGDDGTIRIWDIISGKEKKNLEFGNIETDTICILNGTIYAGNDDGEISLIKDHNIILTKKAHKAGIKNITSNKDLNLIVSSSYDCSVLIWEPDLEKGIKLLETVYCPLEVWLRASVIVDSETIAFGTFGSTYCTYNRKTKKWNLDKMNPTYGINAVTVFKNKIISIGDAGIVFSNKKEIFNIESLCNFLLPFGEYLITGGQAGIIYNALSGEIIYKHYSPINCGAIVNRDGKLFAVIGTYTGEGIVIEEKDNKLVFHSLIKLHNNAVKGLSANDTHLFSICATGACSFFLIKDFTRYKDIPKAHDKIANGVTVIGDGSFVSVSRDLKMRIWEETILEPISIATPHTHSIKCVASGGDNKMLIATGSYDGTIAIYDVIQQETLVYKRVSSSGISSISYNTKLKNFLFSSYDGNIYKEKIKSYITVLDTIEG